jgi:hypothetical protein
VGKMARKGALRSVARTFATRACAAAVCSAFSMNAMAQAITPAQRADIDVASSTGFVAGLDRAFKTPLEVVWLRAAAEAEMWSQPALAQAVQRCDKAGDAKQGCAVIGRTAWRHVFGGNSPTIEGAARLIVSSLNLPNQTFVSGRLNLTGSGRVYVITPEPEKPGAKPASGAIVLAAGTSVQIVDVMNPGIQIELKAPDHEALLLGSLAATDLGKAMALLVGKSAASASEATVDRAGRVALRSSGEVQFAMVGPLQGGTGPLTALAKAEPVAVQPVRAEPTPMEFPPIALESERAPASSEFTLVAALAPVAGTAGEILANVAAVRIEPSYPPVALEEQRTPASADFTLLAALAPLAGTAGEVLANAAAVRTEPSFPPVALEEQRTPASVEFTLVASLAPVAGVAGGETLANVVAVRVEPSYPPIALEQERTPASAEFTLVASLAPVAGMTGEMLANVAAVRIDRPVVMEYPPIAALETERAPASVAFTAPRVEPIVVAAAAPVAAPVAPTVIAAAPAAASSELAKMRAEIEAEVQRERERMAATLQTRPAAKRFTFGT